jgi:hypothetical protein
MKGKSMKRTLLILPLAAAAIALSLAPAAAQNGYWQGQQYQNGWNNGGWNQGQQYQNGWNNGAWNNGYNNGWNGEGQRHGWNNGYRQRGWNNRYVSDPSYNANVRFRANPNRCTEDLGYGRYEYCGW